MYWKQSQLAALIRVNKWQQKQNLHLLWRPHAEWEAVDEIRIVALCKHIHFLLFGLSREKKIQAVKHFCLWDQKSSEIKLKKWNSENSYEAVEVPDSMTYWLHWSYIRCFLLWRAICKFFVSDELCAAQGVALQSSCWGCHTQSLLDNSCY